MKHFLLQIKKTNIKLFTVFDYTNKNKITILLKIKKKCCYIIRKPKKNL